jgi:hypothetical protein
MKPAGPFLKGKTHVCNVNRIDRVHKYMAKRTVQRDASQAPTLRVLGPGNSLERYLFHKRDSIRRFAVADRHHL